MPYGPIELLIGGIWQKGDGGGQDILNPADESIIGTCPHASAAQLDSATEAAASGFKIWRDTTPLARQKIIEEAAQLLHRRIDHIAECLTREMGKPLGEAKIELETAIDILRWYGEEGKRAYGRIIPARLPGARQMKLSEPVGPVAAFVAWNFPAVNVMRKVAGALAAGCSITLKPSEETPATAVEIGRAFQDAGLPPGVLNIVFGEPDAVSRHLLASPVYKKLSFTGSSPVGKHLQRLAADTLKRCTMELGGHAPVVVFDDADVDRAAAVMAGHKFRNAGQVCISPTRFYVQENVYSKFNAAFIDAANAMKVGNGMESGVGMGPLIADRRLDVMEDFVADARAKGGTVAAGGERLGNQDYFWKPTVITDVPDDARIMTEEPFGPLAPITPFKGLDDVLERANALPFGLAAYVFTSDGVKAKTMEHALEAGMIGVNHQGVSMPETPFGGVNESGYGSEGGIEGLDAYLRTKFVTEMGV